MAVVLLACALVAQAVRVALSVAEVNLMGLPPWRAPNCPPGTFRCHDRCLREKYLCDGLPDCNFLQDETAPACPSAEACRPGAFFCLERKQPSVKPRRRCFADYRRCDGHQDCEDGSDEQHCLTPRGKLWACGSPSNHNMKVQSVEVVCDGRMDCPDGEDERMCTRPDQCVDGRSFWCDQTCHRMSRWCDTVKDCTDGRDEANCIFTTSTTTTMMPPPPPTTTAPTLTAAPTEVVGSGSALAVPGPAAAHSVHPAVIVVGLLAAACAAVAFYFGVRTLRRRQQRAFRTREVEERFGIVLGDETELSEKVTSA